MGIETTVPKGGMFIWFRTPPGYTSLEYHIHLLEKAHVSITPGHIYGANGEEWIRLSLIANADQLEEAMTRIESATRI